MKTCFPIIQTLAMLCGCLAFPALNAIAQTKPAGLPQIVKLIHPKRGEITRSISLPAMAAANQQVTLYAKVGGYLKFITVDKGDKVKQGDVLAEIEVPELLADQAVAKAELEIAQLEYKRVRDAQAKAPDLITSQSIDSANAKQLVAKARMERAETLLGFTKITAPFAGVVTRRMVDPGAFIPAATSGTAGQISSLLAIADFRTVRIQIAVPEQEVPLIKKGLAVKVSIEELPGRELEGAVTRFSHVLDELTRTMLAEVDLANPLGELRPGMFATAKISVEKRADTLIVPVDAVMVEKTGSSVFTIVDGKAKKAPVKTGFNDGAYVEILDGAQASDALILVGKMTLNNGQPVTIAESK